MHRALPLLLGSLILSACFGSPVDQAPQCARYVACVEALDVAEGATTDLTRYAQGGGCWANAATAEFCTTSCGRGLERLRARLPSVPPECAP